MSGFYHGVKVNYRDTGLVTPAHVESAMPVIVGTAPVHNLPEGVEPPVNKPVLCHTFSEFVAQFGAPADEENPEDFTLWQAAEMYFTRYLCEPIVAINVFDPGRHVRMPEHGEGEVDLETGEESVTTPPPRPDVSLVTAKDIIGTVDPETMKPTGLQLVHKIYPMFRLTPGVILAPKFSREPAVALAIGALCEEVGGLFKAMGIIEIAAGLKNYTEAPAWLNDNNLVDHNLLAIFGDFACGGAVESGSAHLAGVIGARDAANDGIPYWSPSNRRVVAEGHIYGGEPLLLTQDQANYLNSQGIVTALNQIGGLVIWGNRTACYPGITDVKDSSIPIRRMFAWIANYLILTNWQFVDIPASRRRIETIRDQVNIWLNGFTAREYILGGRCDFEVADNPTLDMMDGIYRWHIYVTPPQAAEQLVFDLEYDPAYLDTLVA